MKYLRMFEAAASLFPKRIKVVLLDAVSGDLIGKYKLPAELFPTAFNRPTTIEIQNFNWRVLKADPVAADDFLYSKKLTLYVQNAASISSEQLLFNLPTLCTVLPATGEHCLFNDFTLILGETDWRQLEFLPLLQASAVEDDIHSIEAILNGQPNPLLGYEQQYLRHDTDTTGMAITREVFRDALSNPIWGNVFLQDKGYVQQGFAVRSDSYTYYGTMEVNCIRTLCLSQFNWADDEFMNVLSTFQLSLVDWCNASRISAEAGEEPKSEFIRI